MREVKACLGIAVLGTATQAHAALSTLHVEELIDEKDGAKKYQSFVNSYNYEREHGGINGMTPAEKFMKCLKPQIPVH